MSAGSSSASPVTTVTVLPPRPPTSRRMRAMPSPAIDRLAADAAARQGACRRRGELRGCVAEVLAGVAALVEKAAMPVAVVGHSFGGAVVIQAGLASPTVTAVAALSSQSFGTDGVERLAPRPLFL